MLTLDGVLERAREVADGVLAPAAEQVDRDARWPDGGIRALLAAGLGGLAVPREAGGLGGGLLGLARACEVLAQRCPSTAICFGMHGVGSAVLAAKATDDQRARYLEPICAGAHLTTLALSEPGTGSQFYIPQARLTPGDGGYRLDGTKAFVTNGGHADSYVMSAATPGGAPVGEFSLVVVRGDAAGLDWREPWRGFGMRGNDARTVELRDVGIPRADLLGVEGDELWYVFNVVAPYFLTAMAGVYLGICQAALDEARTHLTTRRHGHSGAALAEQPVLQHRLGTLWGVVERTRRLVYHAAEAGDAGAEDALPALLSAKAEVGDAVVEVTNEAMSLCGGIAYRENARLAQLLRDARAAPVMAPTTDMLRTWLGRALLGLPVLAD